MTWNFDEITRRSTKKRVFHVLEHGGNLRMKHAVELQANVCPRSSEPKSALLEIEYESDGVSLELVSLERECRRIWRESSGIEDAVLQMLAALEEDLGHSTMSLHVTSQMSSGQVVVVGWGGGLR